ncbi:MAG: hypothetical protein JWL66_3068 [Sphingomonadales bacterium]|nr:hypothetical protein [Sphingomonadales bacterium]
MCGCGQSPLDKATGNTNRKRAYPQDNDQRGNCDSATNPACKTPPGRRSNRAITFIVHVAGFPVRACTTDGTPVCCATFPFGAYTAKGTAILHSNQEI